MSGMFVQQQDGSLVEAKPGRYVTEEELQSLIAQYPNLIPGDQIDKQNPRRWLLVNREVGVPSAEDSADRFSVDHLFLDHEGVPTLIEVKRSTDTRIRREVVGQMLDYAANSLAYVPAARIRLLFEQRCASEELSAEEEVQRLTNGDDAEEFWIAVERNLAEGRLRLLFVADAIPSELQRIIEFLNMQMNRVEVLGVEIPQLLGDGVKAFIPRVVGKSEAGPDKNPRGAKRRWDEPTFMLKLEEQDPAATPVAKAILAWAKDRELGLNWGSGAYTGHCSPMITYQGAAHSILCLHTSGRIELQFGQEAAREPWSDTAKRLELLRHFNRVPGVTVDEARHSLYPKVMMADIAGSVESFLAVCDEWLEPLLTGQAPEQEDRHL